LPYKSASFDVVIQCLPVLLPEELGEDVTRVSSSPKSVTMIAPPSLPLTELLRVLNDRGFFIVGFPEILWETYEIQHLVNMITSSSGGGSGKGEWLVMQKIPVPIKDIAVFQDGVNDMLINDWQAFDAAVSNKPKRSGPPVRKGTAGGVSGNKEEGNNSSGNNSNSNSNSGSTEGSDLVIQYCLALFRKK
jgi:hypothetical protein